MHAFFTHSIIMDLDRIISLILKWCDVCTLSKGTVRPKIPSPLYSGFVGEKR